MPVLGRIDPAAAWRQAWNQGPADRDLRDRSEPYQRESHAEHRSGDGGAGAILLRGSRVCTQPTAEILSASSWGKLSTFRIGSFVCIRSGSKLGLVTGGKPTFTLAGRQCASEQTFRRS